ncbi:MAG: hypothetical protein Q9208_005807 [Pyrenodesmia sp. 3 TL-2023]
MLSIQRANPEEPSTKCTPNLLPCRINHSGPVNASSRYWSPTPSKDGHPEAYFRGRKLKGREVKVPEGYRGVVVKEGVKEDVAVQRGNAERLRRRDEGMDEEEEESEEEVKVMEEVGEFDGVVVWGHESVVDGEDTFVRGVEEWIGFAEAMHKPGLEGEGGDAKPS